MPKSLTISGNEYSKCKEYRKIIAEQCGANPKMPDKNAYKKEIEAVKLQAGEDYTDEDIQMLVLGAMMDPESLKNCSTSSSQGFESPEYFAKEVIFMNVLKNPSGRELSYQEEMVHARENVKKALENARKNNDTSLIDRYRKNLAGFLNESGATQVYGGGAEDNIYIYLYKTITKLNKENRFGKNLLTEKTLKNMKCAIKLADILDEVYEKEKKLAEGKISEEDKKKVIADILTGFLAVRFAKEEIAQLNKDIMNTHEYKTMNHFKIFKEIDGGKYKEKVKAEFGSDYEGIFETEWINAMVESGNIYQDHYIKNDLMYSSAVFSDDAQTAAFMAELRKLIEGSETFKNVLAVAPDKIEETLAGVFGNDEFDIKGKRDGFKVVNEMLEKLPSGSGMKTSDIKAVTNAKKKALKNFTDNIVKYVTESFENKLEDKISEENKSVALKKAQEKYGEELVSPVEMIGERSFCCIAKKGFYELVIKKDEPKNGKKQNNKQGSKNIKWELKRVKNIPIPNMLDGRNTYYKLMSYKLGYDKDKGCNAFVNIGAYIKVLKEGKDVDGALLDEITGLMDKVRIHFDETTKKPLGTEDLKKLIDSYQTVSESITNYIKANSLKDKYNGGYNRLLSDINNLLQEDMTTIKPIVDEPKGQKKIFLNKLFNEREIAEKDLGVGKELLDKALVQAGKSSTFGASEYARGIIKASIYEKMYGRNLDGSFITENGVYFDKDGKAIDKNMKISFLKNNEEAYRQEIADRIRRKVVHIVNNPEIKLLDTFKEDNRLKNIPESRERQDYVDHIRDNILKAVADAEFEDAISSDVMAEQQDGWISAYYKKTGGTEADREWNRKLDEKLNSTDLAEQKECMEMLLEYIGELRLDQYTDVWDDSVLFDEKKVKDIVKLSTVGLEIGQILKKAADLGVNLNSEKYAALKNNAQALSELGALWKAKLSMWFSPVSEHIEPNDILHFKTDDFESVMTKTVKNGKMPMARLFFTGAEHFTFHVQKLAAMQADKSCPLLGKLQNVVLPLVTEKRAKNNMIAVMCGGHPVIPEANAHKAEIEAVTISSPQFTDSEIQLLVLGAMMDKEIMDKCSSTSSSEGVDLEIFKRDNIFVNALKQNSKREESYSANMVQARKNALEAIKKAEAGDTALIEKFHKNVADYLNGSIGTHIYDGGDDASVYMTFYHLVDDMGKAGKFDMNLLSKKTRGILECNKVLEDTLEDASLKEKMLRQGGLSEDEKKKLVKDIIKDHMITEFASQEIRAVRGSFENSIAFTSMQKSFETDNMKTYRDVIINKNKDLIEPSTIKMVWEDLAPQKVSAKFNAEFEKELPLYTPILLGNDKLKSKYMAELEAFAAESDLYEKFMQAGNSQKLEKAIRDAWGGMFGLEFGRDDLESVNNIIYKIQAEAANEDVGGLAEVTAARQKLIVEHTNSLEKDWKKAFGESIRERRAAEKCKKLRHGLEKSCVPGGLYTIEDTTYYRGADGKYQIIVEDKAEDWKVVTLDDFKFPESASGRTEYYKYKRQLLAAKTKENVSQVADRLGVYINAMEKIAESDGSAELLDGLKVLYGHVTGAIKEKRLLNSADFAAIKDEYNECIQMAGKYFEGHPENVLVEDVTELLKADLPDIERLAEHPIGVAGIYFNEAFDAQMREKGKNDISFRTEIPAFVMKNRVQLDDIYFEYFKKLTNVFLGGQLRAKIDGRYDERDGYRVLADGRTAKGFVMSDHLMAEIDKYREFLENNRPKPSFEIGDDTRRGLKILDKNRQAPTKEEINERLERVKKLNKTVENRKLGYVINSATNQHEKINMPRELMGALLKKADNEQNRAWNRKMLTRVASDNKQEVKTGFKMVMEYLKEFDPAHKPPKYNIELLMNIKDNSVLEDEKKLDQIYEIVNVASEFAKVFQDAQHAGVDIYSAEYDGIRKTMDALSQMSMIWKSKINYCLSPISAYIPIEELDNYDDKAIQTICDLFSKSQEATLALTNYTNLRNTLKESGRLFEEETAPAFEEFAKTISRSEAGGVNSDDAEICQLRNRMAANERSFLVWKIDNSDLYDNVIKAIDAYRDAPIFKKNVMRKKIIQACKNYCDNRLNENDRYELVTEVENWAKNAEKTVKDLIGKAAVGAMDRVIDNYSEQLKIIENNQPGENKLSQAILGDKYLMKVMYDTKAFRKFVNSNGGYEPDKDKFNMISAGIMREVAQKSENLYAVDPGYYLNHPIVDAHKDAPEAH